MTEHATLDDALELDPVVGQEVGSFDVVRRPAARAIYAGGRAPSMTSRTAASS